MKLSKKEIVLLLVVMILTFILSVFLGGFIFWGLGNLIIYAFNLGYTWSFLQGLCISLIVSIIFPDPIKLKLTATTEKGDDKKDDETTASEDTK